MGGKASILMVLGFSMIMLIFSYNYSRLTVGAVDNEVQYYKETIAQNIAISGANIGANQLFLSKTWSSGFTNVSFNGGRFTVTVSTSGDLKTVTSVGTYEGVSKTVRVILRPSYYAKFGNFYSSMSAQPATGDTFFGPFHVNSTMYTYGTPVFWGKTTSKGKLSMGGVPKDPKFYGGYESGIDIPLEFDTTGMRSAAQAGGKVFMDTLNKKYDINISLQFNADASVTWKYSRNDGKNIWTAPRTESLSTLAPNGIIYIEKGNLYVKGTVNGRYTVVASSRGSSKSGFVYQQDDIIYNVNPVTNPASTDILGIVAEKDVRIEYNADTRWQDVKTHASIFSLKGSVGPADSLISQAYLGTWEINGGIIAKTTRQTATYGTVGGKSVPIKGLKVKHIYDERFRDYVPPYYPNTKHYEIVSWFE